jgi:antitoxin (DNA-binding transcriptional repressor) of toxin-antitoxin stability system
MHQISLEEAATQLLQLVKEANGGEEIVLTQDDQPVARIVPLPRARAPRKPGSAKGLILHIAEDFDATPEGFEEYMP